MDEPGLNQLAKISPKFVLRDFCKLADLVEGRAVLAPSEEAQNFVRASCISEIGCFVNELEKPLNDRDSFRCRLLG